VDENGSVGRRAILAVAGAGGLIAGAATLVRKNAAQGGQLALAASSFGYTDDGTHYVINTGAGLVFKVSHVNGDLTSLVYKGTEYQGYSGQNSQVESGLGASSVSIKKSGAVIVVSVAHGTLRHYYAARSGEDNVYMWTNKADASVTAMRYIVRVAPGRFPNTGAYAWDSTRDTVIEARDIWRTPSGQTRSKHYSEQRVIDYRYVGFTSGTVGMWIVRSNHEKASGGPFYRSLLLHSSEGGGGIYEILYYGENQTEPERFGLQGPYVLTFTSGGAPSPSLYPENLNISWVDSLGIPGWVGAAGRGAVAGVGLSGMASGAKYTVGFANAAAQYWAVAEAGTGRFDCRGMLPGTYALTVYKGELAVHSATVKVTAGQTLALHTLALTGDPSAAAAIWRIGQWDGTPSGFKNAALMLHAHPSDVRAAPWAGAFTVGSSAVADFPCYLWKGVNDGIKVSFTLTAAQASSAHVLNIGITTAYANGRPQVSVNGKFSSAVPAPATEVKTRSLTVGDYRGNNHTYSFTVPASALRAGTNTLVVNVASGTTGSGYLNPGFAVDAVELLA
jgi:rhamnogalacturonan endolyase